MPYFSFFPRLNIYGQLYSRTEGALIFFVSMYCFLAFRISLKTTVVIIQLCLYLHLNYVADQAGQNCTTVLTAYTLFCDPLISGGSFMMTHNLFYSCSPVTLSLFWITFTYVIQIPQTSVHLLIYFTLKIKAIRKEF